MTIALGVRGYAETVVEEELTAASAGSGDLPVFATPAMVALIEQAAYLSIQPFLEEGDGSVGCSIQVSHVSATPLGMAVRAETEVTAVDGRMVTFAVRAYDAAGLIGEGTHVRAVIHKDRFLQKTYQKQ